MLYRGEAVRAEARKLASMGTGTYLRELALHNFDGDFVNNRVDFLKNVGLPEDNWKAVELGRGHPSDRYTYKPLFFASLANKTNKRDSKQLDKQFCAGVAPIDDDTVPTDAE